MELVRAAILGIVQGLTEFLPISSSGHLILVPALFDWPDQGLAFDVGLHMGTLFALLVYFWRDWARLFASGWRDFWKHGFRFGNQARDSQLLWLLALGSVPAAVVGLVFNDWIEEHVRQPWLVALMLVAGGLLLLGAERFGRRERAIGSVGVVDALLIGAGQALALIPGVSRSGATMSAGMFRGLTRDDAARFAFLLGTPAFVGAAALKAKDLAGESGAEYGELAVGLVCSALVGFIAIHGLLRFLRTRSLMPFVYYRFGVAILALIIGGIRVA